jgi:hypothetical protein
VRNIHLPILCATGKFTSRLDDSELLTYEYDFKDWKIYYLYGTIGIFNWTSLTVQLKISNPTNISLIRLLGICFKHTPSLVFVVFY